MTKQRARHWLLGIAIACLFVGVALLSYIAGEVLQ